MAVETTAPPSTLEPSPMTPSRPGRTPFGEQSRPPERASAAQVNSRTAVHRGPPETSDRKVSLTALIETSRVAAAGRIDTGTALAPASTVVGVCVGDCALCGDHNRIAIVSSASVVSRCLRCRDETVLTALPAWCQMTRQWQASYAASRPAKAARANAHPLDDGVCSN